MLPADNSKATTIGVYNNDDATSKMSYYMNSTVAVDVKSCTVPTYVVTTKVTDTLRADQVPSLTRYVLANQARIPSGGDRQWVQIYGPVGSKLVSATIDGVRVIWGNDESSKLNTVLDATGQSDYRPAVKGVLYGRPVGSVSITMGPTQSVTVQARFSGATGASPVVEVSHTPKVRPVPVTITKTACG
jgi:hypothetical protein